MLFGFTYFAYMVIDLVISAFDFKNYMQNRFSNKNKYTHED